MIEYRFDVALTHIFLQTETLRVCVEAETEEDARKLCVAEARRTARPDGREAERDETQVDQVELIDARSSDPGANLPPIRCPDTMDIFESGRAGA